MSNTFERDGFRIHKTEAKLCQSKNDCPFGYTCKNGVCIVDNDDPGQIAF